MSFIAGGSTGFIASGEYRGVPYAVGPVLVLSAVSDNPVTRWMWQISLSGGKTVEGWQHTKELAVNSAELAIEDLP